MSPQKIQNMTDPAVSVHDGENRCFWSPFRAGETFPRRSGKAVDKHFQYQKASAISSTLAGFLQVDAAGVSGGHPETVVAGDEMLVDFGLHKAGVFPTTNRVALDTDRGQRFDVLVDATGVQYINMTSSLWGVVQVEKVLDASGEWVAASIPSEKRYGSR